jgi:hypothetical protein
MDRPVDGHATTTRNSIEDILVLLAAVMVPAAALMLILQLSLASATQSTNAGPPPTCPSSCGNLSVPYPFGIGANCSLPGFNLTCDRTRHPPRLLLGDGALQIVEISLANSTVRALNTAGAVNINFSTSVDGSGTWSGGLGAVSGSGSPYVVSEWRNQLVVTGCNVQGTLLGGSGNIITGCSSFCSIDDKWAGAVVTTPGDGATACSGIRCCETPIPIGRPSYTVQFKYLDVENTGLLPVAVRIAERGWFDSVAAQMLNNSARDSTSLTPVPVVLDWAVASTPIVPGTADADAAGNSSCPSDAARSACRSSHSTCHNVTNNYWTGYVCRCQKGYDGNPYLSGEGGCQGTHVVTLLHGHGTVGCNAVVLLAHRETV